MDAMNYEYLLRAIYQVDRGGRKEADADVYRELEHAQRDYQLDLENIQKKQMRLSSKSIDQLEYEYNVQCRKIWFYVKTAIEYGLSKYGHKFGLHEIQTMKELVAMHGNCSKEYIDSAIGTMDEIYFKHNLFPE